MYTSKKPAVAIIIFTIMYFFLFGYALAGNNPGEQKSYSRNQFTTESIAEQPHKISVKTEMSAIPFSDLADQDRKDINTIEDYLHPSLADDGSGNLARLYEGYDGVSPLSLIYINGSDDDGANWTECCWVELSDPTYPSIEYWGSGTDFFGTFVPPSTFQNGGAFFVIYIPDQMDPETWNVGWAGTAALGWHSMRMVDIAADDGQQSWNWGFESAVISRSYISGDLYDVPVIYGWVNLSGSGYVSYYDNDFDSCRTTAADIDHTNGKSYAVYDRYNLSDDQYKLLIRQDYFYDWDDSTDGAVKSRLFIMMIFPTTMILSAGIQMTAMSTASMTSRLSPAPPLKRITRRSSMSRAIHSCASMSKIMFSMLPVQITPEPTGIRRNRSARPVNWWWRNIEPRISPMTVARSAMNTPREEMILS